MKEKTIAAMNIIWDFTTHNRGFVLVWAVSIAVVLKLACA